ncbi:MAG: 2Fe-2S iron-sulfur cluster binding domain-containing protein [Hyphomonadaceae bacterium]|nr:2Fe-2S iron-sulfur cluster binding domain-containing protein [Hyphomonadaceae bacterium]
MQHDFHPVSIAEVKRETPEAISVAFAVPEALREVFRFQPGQHLTLRRVLDTEEVRRNYSICSGPGDTLRIAIKRIAGGYFSVWANETLAAGMVIDVMPPQGRFVLPASDGRARHVVAFAAGVGITPVLAMVKQALQHEPATSFTLIYGNRMPQTILFRQELEDLKDRHLGRFTLLNVLSRNDESSTPLFEGRITADKVQALANKLFRPEDVAHVFLCGPGSMIKDTRTALFDIGFPRERVHHEFFAPGGGAFRKPHGIVQPSPIIPEPAVGTEVVAILDGLRHRFTVPPGGHVVDAALAAGVRVPYACKGGMCCTCRAKLVEGRAEMTTNYSLEPWEIERGFILTCQAVPKSDRLVLDYDQM